jgi:hypothetical protein
MIKKGLLLSSLLISSLYSNECSPYFNPDKFYEVPEYLEELIVENIEDKNLVLFGDFKFYEKLKFEKNKDLFINKYISLNEYKYPVNSGLFEYSLKENKVDEMSIAKVEIYKYGDLEIADEINDNLEEFWSDWIEDAYEMKLLPEQVLFNYQDIYFTFSVFIYGVKNDGTNLKGTSVKYWFKNYTKEVNEYKECISKK